MEVNEPVLKLTSEEETWLDAYRKELPQRHPGVVVRMLIYGSKARGEARAESDLDVLLIVKNEARCAAVCPGDAIPRQAQCGAPLAEYRGLDSRACARYSQPHGVGASVDHFQALLERRDAIGIKAKIDSCETSLLWYNMTVLRQGAFTGCSRCLQVCPVGNDYEKIQASPHRQRDLPVGLKSQISGDQVSIRNCGGARF